MLFTKLEKAPFFLPPSDFLFLLTSSLYRWRGDLAPDSVDRGGVIVSMVRASELKLMLCRSFGDFVFFAKSAVYECWTTGRVAGWWWAAVAAAAAVLLVVVVKEALALALALALGGWMLLDWWKPWRIEWPSNGEPTRSRLSARDSEAWDEAAVVEADEGW